MKYFTRECLKELYDRVQLTRVVDCFELDSRFCYVCPFCGAYEFVIDDNDKLYRCDSCAAEGDAVNFLMAIHKMSFNDAIELTADMFDVKLKSIGGKGNKKNFIDVPKDLVKMLDEFVDDPNLVRMIILSYVDRKKRELRGMPKKEKTSIRKKKKGIRKTKKGTKTKSRK